MYWRWIFSSPSLNYLGNLAWDDLNENGLQDEGEPGIEGVVVRLLTDSDGEVDSDVTDENGLFGFIDVNAGNYRLHFKPPHTATVHYQLTAQDAGDETIDSDLGKVNNSYKTGLIALTDVGSFLYIDGGFIKRPPTDPVDTIRIDLAPQESVLVCDDAFENGLVNESTSTLCDQGGDLLGSTFDTDTPGCLSFTAGDLEGGPIAFCLLTTNDENSLIDTTIFIVNINNILSTDSDAFDSGSLTLLQNPVSSILYLKNNMSTPLPLKIMLSDMSGRQLAQVTDDGFNRLISIHVDELSRGMYVLTVFTDEALMGVRRFIKR